MCSFNLSPFRGPRFKPGDCSLFLRVAGAPQLLRLLEALVCPDHFADITSPALHVAAWYDIQGGSLQNYMDQGACGPGRACRPATHRDYRWAFRCGRKIGDVDFGPAADDWDETAVVLGLYDTCSKHPNRLLTTSQ